MNRKCTLVFDVEEIKKYCQFYNNNINKTFKSYDWSIKAKKIVWLIHLR